MKKGAIAGIIILAGLAALAIFHLFHALLFCRYRAVPEKSHCRVCGHRRACRKFHRRIRASAGGGTGRQG